MSKSLGFTGMFTKVFAPKIHSKNLKNDQIEAVRPKFLNALYDLENQASIEKLRTDTEIMCQRLENDYSVDNFTMFDVIDNKILCYHSTSLVKKSVSPAFEPKQFGGWRLSEKEGALEYSTYTESVWSEDGFSLRFFFLYENGFFSSVVLIGGAVLTTTVGYLNSWVNKNSDILFAN